MSNYSDLHKDNINNIISAYSRVTENLIGVTYPCPDSERVIADIKKAESEDNSLTHSDDLSQILEEDYPEAGQMVRDYFKLMVSEAQDIEDYASR